MLVDILDQIEDIVHVVVTPLGVNLVDEEVPPFVLGVHPIRNDDDHLLNLPGQDQSIQSRLDIGVGQTGYRHVVSRKEIKDGIGSGAAPLIPRWKVDPKSHPAIQRRTVEESHPHFAPVPEQLIRIRPVFASRKMIRDKRKECGKPIGNEDPFSKPPFDLCKAPSDILLVESHMPALIPDIDPLLIEMGDSRKILWKAVLDPDVQSAVQEQLNEISGVDIKLKLILCPCVQIEVQPLKRRQIEGLEMAEGVLGQEIPSVGVVAEHSVAFPQVSGSFNAVKACIKIRFPRVKHSISVEIGKGFM